jgi:hypothetical protein
MNASRRNLVVVRAGDRSLHPVWLAGESARNFDIFVSYFGTSPGKHQAQADYYEAATGLKFPALARLLAERSDMFSRYDAYWFPDDDLLADSETIGRMFELFHQHDLWLAQPALGPGSHLTYPATAQCRDATLRFAGFVEVMCPVFSRFSLGLLGSTFSASASGWGLDFLWAHLLKNPQSGIAILDETPVVHTRPVGGGSFYAECKKIGVNPRADLERILKQHGLGWTRDIPIYKTLSNSRCCRT